jgi:hypothetical protein
MQLVFVVKHSPQFESHSWQIDPDKKSPVLHEVQKEAESLHVLQLAEHEAQVFDDETR